MRSVRIEWEGPFSIEQVLEQTNFGADKSSDNNHYQTF